jgi:hypothetical protein
MEVEAEGKQNSEEDVMKLIEIKARSAAPELMDRMEEQGLLRRLRPSGACLSVTEGEQLVEQVELAEKGTGPWQMLAVACNRVKLDHLAAHGDAESWLFFSAEPTVKPLLYVVATCRVEQFEKRVEDGTLSADDFIALELSPNDPETSFFTVPGGVMHDELTYQGSGTAPVFFVPEPSEMAHRSVSLEGYDVVIHRSGR